MNKHILKAFVVVVSSVCFVSQSFAQVPSPVFYVNFEEGSGSTAQNRGSAGGSGELTGTAAYSDNVPSGSLAPANNTASMDFGDFSSGVGGDVRFVDTDPTDGFTTLTITAWVFPVGFENGPGGNRIVSSWPSDQGPLGLPGRRSGIDLVWIGGEQLQFAVNQAPDWPADLHEGPFSGEGTVFTEDVWYFIAVTYDTKTDDLELFPDASQTPGYAGQDGVVQFFVGTADDVLETFEEQTFDVGPVLASGEGIYIGNFTQGAIDAHGVDRAFRGWIDEVAIFDSVLTASQIADVQMGNISISSTVDSWSIY